jgi:predicted ATP-grasp superfamily ATP-dependent carboligase
MIFGKGETNIMVTLEQIVSDIAELKVSVDRLIEMATKPPVDLEPAHEAITALKAEVDALTATPDEGGGAG